MWLSRLRRGHHGHRLALPSTLAGAVLVALAASTGPSFAGLRAEAAAAAHVGAIGGGRLAAGRARAATPPPCVVKVVDYVFHPPQVVVNGGTAVLELEIANCTQQSEEVTVTQSGAEPAGCPVLDPVAWHVTIAADGTYRHSLETTDPSCTGLEHMLVSVSSGMGTVLASRSAYLTVIPADATRAYASDANRRYRLRVGATLGVSLSGPTGFTWTEPASSKGKVLARSAGAGGSSASAVFAAKATGTATVPAIDNPNCYPICQIASRSFEITVTVVAKKPATRSS